MIDDTAVCLNGQIRPLWMGWRVQSTSRRIDWVGSVFGVHTIIDGASHEGLRALSMTGLPPDAIERDSGANYVR